MLAILVRRLIALPPLLLGVSIVVFGLVLLVPGDAALTLAGGENATPERVAEVREELGLEDTFVVQYGRWLSGAAKFDFGESLRSGRPVTAEVMDRLPVTMALCAAALLFALAAAVPLALISAVRSGGVSDRAALAVSTLFIAIPGFWLAMILVVLFAIERSWFPALGFVPFGRSPVEWAKHLVLPGIALGATTAAYIVRQLRASLINVLGENYIRTAWAQGLSTRSVIGKHALKNAAIPAVTVLGLQAGVILGNTVVFETIFSQPGLGTYLVEAVRAHDLPAIQAITVLFVLANVLINLLVDLTYGLLNPKVRTA